MMTGYHRNFILRFFSLVSFRNLETNLSGVSQFANWVLNGGWLESVNDLYKFYKTAKSSLTDPYFFHTQTYICIYFNIFGNHKYFMGQ